MLLLALLAWARPGAALTFEDVTEAVGLKAPLEGLVGHGGAWGDLDGDGFPELYVGSFSDRPGGHPSQLFSNVGGRFREVMETPARLKGRTTFAAFADFDADGDNDLWVANNAKTEGDPAKVMRSKLFANRDGRLVEVEGAAPAGLVSARNALPLDLEGDGRLDLLLLEDRFTPTPRSLLWRNLGGLRFGPAPGLPEGVFGLGGAVADLNDDGRPDFFIADSNRLFVSRPEGGYQEQSDAFTWTPLHPEDWPSGAAFGDLNRDGLLDMVLGVHHVRARNKVYFNVGTAAGPRFEDVTRQVGLPDEVPVKCPHVEIQDFDNDGWPDIYVSAARRSTPLVFRNQNGRFTPTFPPARAQQYFLGATCDYDRDGLVDILQINWFKEHESRLLRNRTRNGNRWLQVEAPVGTRLRLFAADQLVGYQEVAVAQGYSSGQEPACHFGLGSLDQVVIEARLPGGKTLRREVAANRRIRL